MAVWSLVSSSCPVRSAPGTGDSSTTPSANSERSLHRLRTGHPGCIRLWTIRWRLCPDASRHLAAARRASGPDAESRPNSAARRSSGHGLVEEFAAIRELLGDLDYLEGWAPDTARSEIAGHLQRVGPAAGRGASRTGCSTGSKPAELAALVSVFVYEPRTDTASVAEFPTALLGERWETTRRAVEGLGGKGATAPAHPDPSTRSRVRRPRSHLGVWDGLRRPADSGHGTRRLRTGVPPARRSPAPAPRSGPRNAG